jgi:hypothetical protein
MVRVVVQNDGAVIGNMRAPVAKLADAKNRKSASAAFSEGAVVKKCAPFVQSRLAGTS